MGLEVDAIHIVIIAFDRPDLLSKLIKSTRDLTDLKQTQVHVVQQLGNDSVDKVIEANKDLFNQHIKTNPQDVRVDMKISANRIAAYELVFETLQGSAAIIFEDDVLISNDTLVFFKSMLEQFGENPKFRGVNFGSLEPANRSKYNQYFIQRFGLHGPASGITRNTWTALRPHLDLLIPDVGSFDVAFEQYLRTGFMISPARSRYLDFGADGTHTGPASSHYFKGLSESWIGQEAQSDFQDWRLSKPTKLFRDDCFEYKKSEDTFFQVLWVLKRWSRFSASRLIHKILYKFVYIPKCEANRQRYMS